MPRLALAVLAAAVTLVLAAPAAADHHAMKVNEVATSYGPMNGQFVELKDDSDEPFPATSEPYGLAAFDASGNPAGVQDLGNPFLLLDTSEPFLIASAATGIGTGDRDDALNITLPTPAGSICFTSGAFGRVHCVAYGCPAGVPTSFAGSQSGLAPPDEQSLQRVPAGLSTGVASPRENNTPPGSPANCPTPPGGGGGAGGGAGGGGPAVVDRVAPGQALTFRRTQDIDRLAVAVRLDERATLAVTGTVNVPLSSRIFRFRTVRRSVTGGARTSVRLRLSRSGLRTAKRYLRRPGRRLTAKVRVSARDRAGNSSLRRVTIRLRN